MTTQQQKENQSKFDIPLLRVPHEQERNAKRINIQDDPQYKMTTFSLENDEDNTKPSLAEEEPKNNKKKMIILTYLHNKIHHYLLPVPII
ncbi:hypothetical protein ACMHUM_16835 [Proteus mirabilis]